MNKSLCYLQMMDIISMSNASVIVPLVTHDYYERVFVVWQNVLQIQKYKKFLVQIYFTSVTNCFISEV